MWDLLSQAGSRNWSSWRTYHPTRRLHHTLQRGLVGKSNPVCGLQRCCCHLHGPQGTGSSAANNRGGGVDTLPVVSILVVATTRMLSVKWPRLRCYWHANRITRSSRAWITEPFFAALVWRPSTAVMSTPTPMWLVLWVLNQQAASTSGIQAIGMRAAPTRRSPIAEPA